MKHFYFFERGAKKDGIGSRKEEDIHDSGPYLINFLLFPDKV